MDDSGLRGAAAWRLKGSGYSRALLESERSTGRYILIGLGAGCLGMVAWLAYFAALYFTSQNKNCPKIDYELNHPQFGCNVTRVAASSFLCSYSAHLECPSPEEASSFDAYAEQASGAISEGIAAMIVFLPLAISPLVAIVAVLIARRRERNSSEQVSNVSFFSSCCHSSKRSAASELAGSNYKRVEERSEVAVALAPLPLGSSSGQ